MGRSFRSLPANLPLPEFNNQTFYHPASQQYFTAHRRDGKPYLRRHQVDANGSITNVLEKEVHYVFGSGNHARSYLHRTPGGKLLELPLSWYSENGGYWAMSPAYDRPDHPGFSREITYRCLFCHNAYPETVPGSDDWDGASTFAARLPEGIDCQRCHGPGQDHVQAVQRGEPRQRVRNTIVNPARLTSDRQLEICFQCHLETTSLPLPPALLRFDRGVFSYRPGEPLANYMLHFDHAPGTGHEDKFELVSSVYRLRKSACFQASGGALTCTTCHNPHQASRGEDYTQACLRCHSTALAKLVDARRHPAAQECTSCHMPRRRPSDAVHTVITDHYIRARPTPDRAGPLQEEHEGNTRPYSGEVTLYYPATLPPTPQSELYLAIAQVKQQSNLPDGLRRLERAIEQYRPAGSEPYFELAEAWWLAGRTDRALPLFEQAAKRRPLRWQHLYEMGLALAAANQPTRSVEALERARSLAPGEAVILNALGEIYSRQGKLPDAVSTFRKALSMNPDLPEGPNNLGTTLLRLGDLDGAETALREAVRLRPEISAPRLNLAQVLSSKGKLPEAKHHLEKAIHTGPSTAAAHSAYLQTLAATGNVPQAQARRQEALRSELSDMHSNLGTVLVALGEREAAISHYRLAVDSNPASPTAHFNLGLSLADQGQPTEAMPFLEKAVQYAPDLFEAHLKLGELLLARGQAAQAAPHLRKAAQSPDARVRKAATDLLAASTP
jgi:tetratricopeptide (TPR) repeat protein